MGIFLKCTKGITTKVTVLSKRKGSTFEMDQIVTDITIYTMLVSLNWLFTRYTREFNRHGSRLDKDKDNKTKEN